MIIVLALSAFLTAPGTAATTMALSRGLDIYTTFHTTQNGSCRETTPSLTREDGSYRAGKAIGITVGYVVATYVGNRLARRLNRPWLSKLTAGASYAAAVPTAWETIKTVRQCRW